MNAFEHLLKKAADEAEDNWTGVASSGPFEVTVTRCYRDGYPYYRQSWRKDGVVIKKADAEKQLSLSDQGKADG